jgi:hypothetical protein
MHFASKWSTPLPNPPLSSGGVSDRAGGVMYFTQLKSAVGLLVVLLGNVKFITSHISKIADLQKLRKISFQASSAFWCASVHLHLQTRNPKILIVLFQYHSSSGCSYGLLLCGHGYLVRRHRTAF